MVDFGPAGRCELMDELKIDMMKVPRYLSEVGLTAFEYPLTRGVNLPLETAKKIGDEFKKYNIKLSVHGPFYINLANVSDEMAEKSFSYIISSLKIMDAMGADRLVFHPGALMGQTRAEAQALILKRLKQLIPILNDLNLLEGKYLCPETMGKHGQCGTVSEVAQMCAIDSHIMPTIDFGHINAFGNIINEPPIDNFPQTFVCYICHEMLTEKERNDHMICHYLEMKMKVLLIK